jgi:hypothetical protein
VLAVIFLDTEGKIFQNSTPSNGSESGGGHFPARFFAPSGPAIPENQLSGEKKGRTQMNTLILQLKKVSPLCLIVYALGLKKL